MSSSASVTGCRHISTSLRRPCRRIPGVRMRWRADRPCIALSSWRMNCARGLPMRRIRDSDAVDGLDVVARPVRRHRPEFLPSRGRASGGRRCRGRGTCSGRGGIHLRQILLGEPPDLATWSVRLPQRSVLASSTGNARSVRWSSFWTTMSFCYSCSRRTVSRSAVGHAGG